MPFRPHSVIWCRPGGKGSTMKRLAGMAGVLAAALVAAFAVFLVVPERPRQSAFDPVAWNEGAGCVRARMVEDLTTNRLNPGMARAGVEALLGRSTARFRGTMDCLDFEIGRCDDGAKAGDEVLAVCFTGNGKLTKVWAEPK